MRCHGNELDCSVMKWNSTGKLGVEKAKNGLEMKWHGKGQICYDTKS